MVLIEAEFPDTLPIQSIDVAALPPGWNAPLSPSSTKDIGTAWAVGKGSAVLSVPSAVIPRERNYLLNPNHFDFSQIRFSAAEPFRFDPRLR